MTNHTSIKDLEQVADVSVGAFDFQRLLDTTTSAAVNKALPSAKPTKTAEAASKSSTAISDFDQASKPEQDSGLSVYQLFMLMQTPEQQEELEGLTNEELFERLSGFVNSIPALRDMEMTAADGTKTTVGKAMAEMASRYAGDTSHDHSVVERGLSNIRGVNLDNNLRYSGNPLLHSSLKVLRETSDYGARNTGIKGASTFHKGIDLGASMGTDVRTGTDAQVAFVGHGVTGYGNLVILNHGSGVLTLYGHLTDSRVSQGQHIKAGQIFADSGDTGVGKAHLHFETIVYNERNGKWTTVDPNKVLSGEFDLSTPQGRAQAIDLTAAQNGKTANGLVSRMAEGTIADIAKNAPTQMAGNHHHAPAPAMPG